MIGYIDNNLDGMWKPCTEEKFYEIVRSQAVARTIAAVRAGNKNRKRALPAFLFCGEADMEAYRNYVEKCRQTGERCKGSRCAQFLRPTGLFMMDFDRTEGEAMELYRKFLSTMREAGISTDGQLVLAHRTPGGHGLRLVMRLRPGSTPQEDQQWIAGLMDEPYDAACKDLSRLSYAVTLDDLFFVDGKVLFSRPHPSLPQGEGVDSADNSSSGVQELKGKSSVSPCLCVQEKESAPSASEKIEYHGLDSSEIVAKYWELTGDGQPPTQGDRNTKIFDLACSLRHIFNFDRELLNRAIPNYDGFPQEEKMQCIDNALREPRKYMPMKLTRVLQALKAEHSQVLPHREDSGWSFPPMPKKLPPLIELLTRHVPAHARAAVAHAVFPALGAHLGGVKFRYVDNVEHEATFMCVLLAKMSSGKSAVNKPIEYVLADIVERDMLNRQREQEWKNSLNTKGANKEKPKRPDDLCIQVLVSDMTNAAFVQRLNDAGEKFLYTQMDEIELLDQLKTSSRGNQVSQLIRLAFDQGLYGQERVGSQSVTARVKVKWNWNASSTIQKGKWYFRNALTDGTLSRLNFCTMEPTKAGEIPVYGTYDGTFADELRPYIDRLNMATGRVVCPEAEALARKLLEENAEQTALTDDEAYEMLSYRANVIAYLKAMTLYIAHGEWTPEIEEFVRWSEEYDLWCKMHFFGEQLRTEMNRENLFVSRGPRNMLELLPTRFSREEAVNVRRAQGKSENPTLMLSNWKKRGYIEVDETTGEYIKTKRAMVGAGSQVVR
ncbi:MAG: hypothetical protein IKK67_05940 [Bacteroidaceae bacterium]|nr:hypothetical protein [Bacteroidaceae bacterium]